MSPIQILIGQRVHLTKYDEQMDFNMHIGTNIILRSMVREVRNTYNIVRNNFVLNTFNVHF